MKVYTVVEIDSGCGEFVQTLASFTSLDEANKLAGESSDYTVITTTLYNKREDMVDELKKDSAHPCLYRKTCSSCQFVGTEKQCINCPISKKDDVVKNWEPAVKNTNTCSPDKSCDNCPMIYFCWADVDSSM